MVAYRRQLGLFLLPYLIGMGLLVVLPALATAAIAFADYNSLNLPRWVGLANFQRLWESPYVQIALRNTLIFVASAIPLRVAGALGLALLLQQRGRTFGFYRSAVYLPTIVPEVAYALHSDAFCLATVSPHKRAAWTFIEYAVSSAGQTLLAESGRTVPSLIEVAESPVFLAPAQPPAHGRVFLDSAPALRGVPIMAAWPAIEELASAEIERAFYGRAGVEDAAAIAVERTLPLFARAAERP